ncbi:MAG TPA: cytochrome c peroxidase [Pirellulales bacterium]|jgi:cytochrome c peroxidase
MISTLEHLLQIAFFLSLVAVVRASRRPRQPLHPKALKLAQHAQASRLRPVVARMIIDLHVAEGVIMGAKALRGATSLVSAAFASLFCLACAFEIALPASHASADDVAVTVSAEAARVRLGYEIYFDAGVLSLEGTMSCASCHKPDPKFGYSDGLRVAIGQRGAAGSGLGLLGVRNVPSLVNVGDKYGHACNADGRAGLGNACLQAVADPLVLGMPSVAAAVDRANTRERYRQLSRIAFGHETLSEKEFRACVVAFLKTLRSDDLPADRLAKGLPTALPPAPLRGWKIFQTHCVSCHQPENGWRDFKYHNVGIASRSRSSDRGRGAVTNVASDDFCFATPSLAECAKSPPYMHDGSLKTLADVVAFFGAGGRYIVNGRVLRDPDIDPEVAAIELGAAQQADLVSFLELGFQGAGYPYRENPHLSPLSPTTERGAANRSAKR